VEVVEFFERRRITARGVDVVEGTVTAPITVTLHDQRISVSQSAHGSVIVRAEALLEGADSVTCDGEFCPFLVFETRSPESVDNFIGEADELSPRVAFIANAGIGDATSR
jgi:hypothetical protein